MLRKFLLLFGTQVLFGGLLFVNNLVLARFLGPEGRGRAALLVLIPTVGVIVVNLGFHLGASYLASRKEYPAGSLFGTALALALGLGAALALPAVLFFGPLRDVLYQGLPAREVAVSLACLPPLLWVFYADHLLISMERAGLAAALRLCQGGVYFAAGLVFVGLLRGSVFGGIVAFAAGAYAAALFAYVAARRASPERFAPDPELLKRGLRFGLPSHPGALADHALYRADSFFLGYLASFQSLGLYSLAVPMAEAVWFLTSAVRPVLFARIARSVSQEANAITPLVLRGALAAALVLGAGLFAAGTIAIRVFLPDFRASIPVLAVLLGATVTALVFQLTLADLSSRGFGKRSSQVALVALPCGIVAYLVLIPRYGIIGAALASWIAYAVESALSLAVYWRLTGVSPARMLLPRVSDLTLLGEALRRRPAPRSP